MRIRILATLLLLGLVNTAGAERVLRDVERPFEITVGQLTLPKDTSGPLTLRACDSCKFNSYRLQGTTTFVLDGREIKYADFARAVDALRGSAAADATVVSVFIDRTTENVTRVAVHRPSR
jgi:hypothetical protein